MYHGKPGQASVWFASGTRGRSHPSECMQIRVRIVSEKDLRYYSGWIRAQTLNGKQLIATAKVGSAAAGDGTAVASAKEERQWSGGTHQMCRELAPDTPPQTKWVNCSF